MTESEVKEAYKLLKRIEWLKNCIDELECVKGNSDKFITLSIHRKDSPTVGSYPPKTLVTLGNNQESGQNLMIKVFKEELEQLEEELDAK